MEQSIRLIQSFLGPRIVKTGIAVFVVLLLFNSLNLPYASFAAVAAILAVQPTIGKAKEVFRQQLLGNLVAGVVATLLGLWLGSTPLSMSLAVILVLGVLTRLKLTEAAGLAVVVVLFIMDRPEKDYLTYTLARLAAITVGMGIGSLVNRFVRPPDIVGRASEEIRDGAKAVDQFLDRLTASLADPASYTKEQIKADGAEVQKHLEAARSLLDLTREGEADGQRLLVIRRANASMFVFSEAVMDIHKLLLEAEGLGDEADRTAVTDCLTAIGQYRRTVMEAVLQGSAPDPAAAEGFAAAIARLQARVDLLVEDRESRSLGLALHGVLAHLRHMGWRMNSLTRMMGEG